MVFLSGITPENPEIYFHNFFIFKYLHFHKLEQWGISGISHTIPVEELNLISKKEFVLIGPTLS